MSFTRVLTILMVCFVTNTGAQAIENLKNEKPQYGFVENKGQIRDQDNKENASVKYILQLPGNNVLLRAGGFSYDTYVTEEKDSANMRSTVGNKMPVGKFHNSKEYTYKYHRVDVDFVGANGNAIIVASEQSKDYIMHYANMKGQGVKVYHYSKITYKEIYPGIDVEFVASPGSNKPVEYNFIVHAGADAKKIQLQYSGAHENKLIDNKLELRLAHGALAETIPNSYRKETGERANIYYKRISSNKDRIIVGFDGDVKVRSETLVIDPTPTIAWATYYGGSNQEDFASIATDNSHNNIFAVGGTGSSNTVASTGNYQNVLTTGGEDIILVKFDSNGSLQWSLNYGGSNTEIGSGIAIDDQGYVYITGYTNSTSSIATPGAYRTNLSSILSQPDAYLAKFNSEGLIQWCTYYGGTGSDTGTSVSLDSFGGVYITGGTTSSYDLSSGSVNYSGWSAFITKFSSSGTFQWLKLYLGVEFGWMICNDSRGNIYVSGQSEIGTTSTLSTPGAYQTVVGSSNASDAFLLKFDVNGNLLWATYYGGSGSDMGYACSVDSYDNVYLSGRTTSTNAMASVGAYQANFGGMVDGFIAKFSSSGERLWGTYYGSSGFDICNNVKTDASANVYIAGQANSNDVFIAKFDGQGALQWNLDFGQNNYGQGFGIATDVSQATYLAGYTQSTGLATSGAYQSTLNGQYDAFLLKIVPQSIPSLFAVSISGNNAYCLGGSGVNISLAGSEIGVNYQLQVSDVNVGSPQAGTNSSLTWSNIAAAGIIKVVATNVSSGLSSIMTNTPSIVLLPSPTAFAASGGSYCDGGSGAIVSLANSENGVNYQLLLNNSPLGSIKAGATNQNLTWPNQAAGDYTILGTNVTTGCQQLMTGIATVNLISVGATASFTIANLGCAFKFTPSIVMSSDCSVAYSWDFGDNTTSAEQVSIHSFASAGNYTVILRIHLSCNPCEKDVTSQQQVTYNPLADSFQDEVVPVATDTRTGILSTSASTFSNVWPMQHEDANLAARNGYLNGTSGVWRNEGNYVYKVPRRQSAALDISKDGTFSIDQFNWRQAQYEAIPNWIKTNTMTQYSPFSYELENRDVLGVYSAALYDYGGHLPSANGVNMRNNEMAFTSFESLDAFSLPTNVSGNWIVGTQPMPVYTTFPVNPVNGNGNVAIIEGTVDELAGATVADVYAYTVTGFALTSDYLANDPIVCSQAYVKNTDQTVIVLNNAPFDGSWFGEIMIKQQVTPVVTPVIDHTVYHSGVSSLKITTAQTFKQSLLQLDKGKEYYINAWVSVGNPNATTPVPDSKLEIDIVVNDKNGTYNTTFRFFPAGPIIEGWQQIKGTFICPIADAQLETTFNPASTGPAWYDDLRLHPQLGNMKSYVYDLNDYRLTATLDEDNFASFYYYDKEGNLYLVKKETEKGVKTISENVSYIKE